MKKIKALFIGMLAAVGLTLAACDEEALRDELDIENTEEVTAEEAVSPTDEFLNDAMAKMLAIEAAQTNLTDHLLKFSDPTAFDDADLVAETNAALDKLDAAAQVELLDYADAVSGETAVTYFGIYKEMEKEYTANLRAGINEVDVQKILDTIAVQDEMMDAYGLASNSVVIGINQQKKK